MTPPFFPDRQTPRMSMMVVPQTPMHLWNQVDCLMMDAAWTKNSFAQGYVKNIYIYTYMSWVLPQIVVPPNHPIFIEFYIINHPFWGTPIFGNTHIYIYILMILSDIYLEVDNNWCLLSGRQCLCCFLTRIGMKRSAFCCEVFIM